MKENDFSTATSVYFRFFSHYFTTLKCEHKMYLYRKRMIKKKNKYFINAVFTIGC